ncbi:MAG TPA: 2-phospho-L-lactate transferase [Gammaproteobacteria bacterium]|nr:2-phospho-L-lactate transferase [Gammaproteobacteria bacterium]HCG71406.1 2-phospho-L-lactate transferase [Gammaproteobacteria bacterium]
MSRPRKILAVTGGVGGAKLAVGLAQLLGPDELMFAVNVGDDFIHLGLHISPDIDSLTYALAGQNNQELGWGRAGETWQFIETLGSLGGDDWFRLGDKDMALHMRRSLMLQNGASLSAATQEVTQRMGIAHRVIPISDDPIRTVVQSTQGDLMFQHYFVRERCEPAVHGFRFEGMANAVLNPTIAAYLADCDAIIICPSNPFVSVAPVIEVAGFLAATEQIPTIAVAPIVGGIALKGPAAKMMQELDIPTTALGVAEHYQHKYPHLLNGFVIDSTDADSLPDFNLPTIATQSVMSSLQDRIALAEACLDFFDQLAA